MYSLLFIMLVFINALTIDSQQYQDKCMVDIAKQIIHQIRVGEFNRKEPYQSDILSKWMSQLNDDTSVSLLSIPGTHDTAAFRCDYSMPCHIFQCQSLSILQQLYNGIRYLDLRVNSEDPLTIGHQSVEFLSFEEALKDISTFLNDNPSEFIILAFQRNTGNYDCSCQIMKQLEKHNIKTIYRDSISIPTVADLRGKVWVYSGLGISFKPSTFLLEGVAGITDHDAIYLQNYWEITPESIPFKTQQTLQTAFNIQCTKSRIKANFMSGSVGITPFDLAINPKGPNNQMEKNIQANDTRQCLGITIMDFPKFSLIKSIVETNGLTISNDLQ